MSKNSRDGREERTKARLRLALVVLLERQDFDEITVTAITGRAKVDRTTFYLHYRDKFELLGECLVEFFQGDIFDFTQDASEDLSQIFATAVEYFARRSLKHRRFLLTVLEDARLPAVHGLVMDFIQRGAEELMHRIAEQEGIDVRSITPERVVLLSSAFYGITLYWLRTGDESNLEAHCREIVAFLKAVVFGGPA